MKLNSAATWLKFAINQLEKSSLFTSTEEWVSAEENGFNSEQSIEEKIQSLCLPYLRVASLLRHHLFNKDVPDVRYEKIKNLIKIL